MDDAQQNEILGLRRQLREVTQERDEWQANADQWKAYAERLQAEIISSEEYRAFVRMLLVEAVEGLESGTPEDMKDSLLAIRDHILPPEERRAAYALEAEQKMLTENNGVCPRCKNKPPGVLGMVCELCGSQNVKWEDFPLDDNEVESK